MAILRALGSHQQYVFDQMKQGFYISVHIDYGSNERYECLTNGSDDYAIRRNILPSFIKRKLVTGKTVYTTVQPDTETIHYTLNKIQ